MPVHDHVGPTCQGDRHDPPMPKWHRERPRVTFQGHRRGSGSIELVQVSGSGVPAPSTLPRSGSRRQAETAHETVASLKWLFLRLQTGWSILGVTLVLIALLELGLEALLAQGPEQAADPSGPARDLRGPQALPGSIAIELEALSDRWQPYVYFRQQPFQGHTITINAEGLRATWEPPGTANAGETRPPPKVLLLGGSSLWGFGARDDRTIPSLIAKELLTELRTQIRNLAEIGYVNTQEMIGVVHELQRGYRPDVVLFYDGVNDTTSACGEGGDAHDQRDQPGSRVQPPPVAVEANRGAGEEAGWRVGVVPTCRVRTEPVERGRILGRLPRRTVSGWQMELSAVTSPTSDWSRPWERHMASVPSSSGSR